MGGGTIRIQRKWFWKFDTACEALAPDATAHPVSCVVDLDCVQSNTYMPKLNPALFDPLTRIENACRRASNIMLTAPDPPRDNEMVLRDVQEIREAPEAFNAAVEPGK